MFLNKVQIVLKFISKRDKYYIFEKDFDTCFLCSKY